MKMHVLILSAFACLVATTTLAQNAVVVQDATGTAYSIGADQPEVGKPMPAFKLDSIVHYKTTRASVNDFKGKWLFLDLWFKGCAVCVKSFPKMNAIQEEFKDKLQVMLVGWNPKTFGGSVIGPLYETLVKRYHFNLPCAFDSLLVDRWGVATMPNIYIIDPEGNLRFITDGYDLSREKVKNLLDGKAVSFTIPWFLTKGDLFPPPTGETPLYRAVLNKSKGENYLGSEYYLEDYVAKPAALRHRGISLIRCSAMDLYRTAYDNWNTIHPSKYYPRFIVETRDSGIFKFNHNDYKGVYNFNLWVDSSRSGNLEYVKAVFQQELKNVFGFEVVSEEREMPVWELTATPGAWDKLKARGRKDNSNGYFNRVYNDITIEELNELIKITTEQYEEVFIDKTGITGKIDIQLEGYLFDFNDFKNSLLKNGLALVRGKKKMKVFTIKDAPKNNRQMKKLIAVIILGLNIVCVQGQDINKIGLTDPVPFDPSVKMVKLPNGFTFYLAKNATMPGRMYMHWLVKAGDMLHDSDQVETAHVVEHILLNTNSRHISGDSVLEKYLMGIGKGFNANPSNEYTQYYSGIPADQSIFRRVCWAFRDWLAQDVFITNDDIEVQKRIVLEEKKWRGALDNMEFMCLTIAPSRFSEVRTMFLDSEKMLPGLSPAAVKRFYKDWYRPDLGGLIVVGDIDTVATEQLIREIFTNVKNPANERLHKEYTIDPAKERKYIVYAKPGSTAKRTIINLHLLQERVPQKTVGNFKADGMRSLIKRMLANRIEDLNYYTAGNLMEPIRGDVESTFTTMGLRVNNLNLSVFCYDVKTIKTDIKRLLEEVERLKRYGFTEKELTMASSQLREALASEKPDFMEQVDALKQHFLFNEAVPADDLKRKLQVKFLEEITLKEINELIRKWILDNNRILTVSTSPIQKAFAPDEATVLKWSIELAAAPLAAYERKEREKVRVNFDSLYRLPAPVNYTRRELPGVDATELKLANGVTVVIKQAVSPSENKVELKASSPGGALQYDRMDYYAVTGAASFLSEAGLGELNKQARNTYLKDHGLFIRAETGDQESAISGWAPNNELEVLMQLAWRFFLTPKMDRQTFQWLVVKRREEVGQGKFNSLSPELSKLVGYTIKSGSGLTPEEWETFQYDKCMKAWRDFFSDPGKFVFVLSGVTDVEAAIKLAAKYLGNLPSAGVKKGLTGTVPFKSRTQPVTETVVNSTLGENSANVSLYYIAPYTNTEKERIKLDLLTKIMERALFIRLREKENGTYVVHAGFSPVRLSLSPLKTIYQVNASFSCDPKRVEELVKAALEEADKMAAMGPDLQEFQKALNQYRQGRPAVANMDDSRWEGYLTEQYLNREDPAAILQREALINSITPADIQQAAKNYLRQECFIKYIEIPKNNHHITQLNSGT